MSEHAHEIPLAARTHQIEANSTLFDDAIRLYIGKMTRDGAGEKSWLRQPNNLISVIAISLSFLGVFYGFWKDKRDNDDKDLQALSAIVLELTKLDSDHVNVMLSSSRATSGNPPHAVAAGANPSYRNAALQQEEQALVEWRRIANNRRLALLAEADRLTSGLGTKAPVNQLAVLGTAFQQIYDFEKAEEYSLATTKEGNSLVTQAMGWKSAGIVNFMREPAFHTRARADFAKASKLLSNSANYNLIGLAVGVDQVWASFELVSNDLSASLARLIHAKELSFGIPCVAGRSMISGPIDRDIQQNIEMATRANITISADVMGKVSKLAADGRC